MDIYILAFTSLFTIINPFGVIPVFVTMTEGLDHKAVRSMAFNASIVSFLCLLFFAIGGEVLFRFFGISLSGLKIVGGILFFIMGYDMLQARISRIKNHRPEEYESLGKSAAITPLAIPMISGPGAITVIILLMRKSDAIQSKTTVLLAALTVIVITYIGLRNGKKLLTVLGETGNKVFLRLMGLIVMMIAVEYFFAGVKPYIKDMF